MITCLHHGATINGRTNKIAAPSRSFWLLNLLATMVAESLAHLMAGRLGAVASLALALLFFIGMLGLQIGARRFIPSIYWLTMIAVTLAGACLTALMASNTLLSTVAGVVALTVLTAAIFIAWHRIGSGIRMFPILRQQTEIFYWLAVSASSTLSLLLTDLLDNTTGGGHFIGSILVTSLLMGSYIFCRGSRRVAVFGMWATFALIRPIGFTGSALLARLPAADGLALNMSTTLLLLSGLMVLCLLIWYRTTRRAYS